MRTVGRSVVRGTYGVAAPWDRSDVAGALRGRIVPAGSGAGVAGGNVGSVSAELSRALTVCPRHLIGLYHHNYVHTRPEGAVHLVVTESDTAVDFADLANDFGLLNAGVQALVRAVKRNIERFPEDFMFQLSRHEASTLESQIVISSLGGARRV